MTPEALDNWRMDEAIKASQGNGFMGLIDAYRDLVRRDVRPAPVEDVEPDRDTLDARAIYAEFLRADSNTRDMIRAGRYDSNPAIPRLRSAIREIKHRAAIAAISAEPTDAMVDTVLRSVGQNFETAAQDSKDRIRGWLSGALATLCAQLEADFLAASETENEN